MSLGITCETVTEVLLSDRWHLVHDQSFDIGAFEFTRETISTLLPTVRPGPRTPDQQVWGAGWKEEVKPGSYQLLCCPFRSILALRCGEIEIVPVQRPVEGS